MLEWLKRHAWKACDRQNWFASSNLALSAPKLLKISNKQSLFLLSLDIKKNVGNAQFGTFWTKNAHFEPKILQISCKFLASNN